MVLTKWLTLLMIGTISAAWICDGYARTDIKLSYINSIPTSGSGHADFFKGSSIFQFTYANIRKSKSFPLTDEEYRILKEKRQGRTVADKKLERSRFTSFIVVKKRISSSDTLTDNYRYIDSILKKYD